MVKSFLKLSRFSQYCTVAIFVLILGNTLLMRPSNYLSSDFKLISMLIDWGILIPLLIYFGFHRNGLLKKVPLAVIIWAAMASALYLAKDDSALKSVIIEYYPYLIFISVMAGLTYVIVSVGYYLTQTMHLHGESRLFYIAKKTVGQGRIGQLITSEWLGLYYLIFGWKTAPQPKSNEFTYHKNSIMKSVFILVTLLTILEMFTVHLVVSIWSENIAWIVTAFTLYFFYVIPAQLNAMKHRLITLSGNHLKLRNGFIISADIAYANILTVKNILISNTQATDRSSLRAQLYDHANVLIELKQEQKIPLIAGFSKTTKTIAVMLDEPVEFVKAMNKRI